MFVSRSMAQKVATVDRETKLLDAQTMMRNLQIRHLPVVDDENRLLGMVTDRDIRSALPYPWPRAPPRTGSGKNTPM
jgi:acetoin utilization protein AcuB